MRPRTKPLRGSIGSRLTVASSMRLVTRGYSTDDAAPVVAAEPFGPGTIVDGRYRIEERLGAGGNGTVFRCFDQKLGAIVA